MEGMVSLNDSFEYLEEDGVPNGLERGFHMQPNKTKLRKEHELSTQNRNKNSNNDKIKLKKKRNKTSLI